jgi:hypothetical protein
MPYPASQCVFIVSGETLEVQASSSVVSVNVYYLSSALSIERNDEG